MPPLKPKATVPVPAPTEPSSTSPSLADFKAAKTSSRPTWRPRMSFNCPSFVSATTGFTERTSSLPGSASIHSISASATRGTFRVFVSRIGVSISPSSLTCVEPMSLPKPLPTKTAAGTFSRKRLPPCGSIAVTPVRTSAPLINVACPTRTPSTSVMASSRPAGSTPTTRPMSRARGRFVSLLFCVISGRRSRSASAFLMIVVGISSVRPPRVGSFSRWPLRKGAAVIKSAARRRSRARPAAAARRRTFQSDSLSRN